MARYAYYPGPLLYTAKFTSNLNEISGENGVEVARLLKLVVGTNNYSLTN